MTDPPPDLAVRSTLEPLNPPGRAALGHVWHSQRWGLVALTVASAALLLVAVAVTQRIAHRDEVMPHVEVAGTDLGNKSEPAAFHEITDIGARLSLAVIHGHAGDQQLTVDPNAIGYRVDAAATVRAARRAGRSANPVDSLAGLVLRVFRADEVPLTVRYDSARLASVIDSWVGATGKGLIEGGLRFDGTLVAEIRPRPGIGIDRTEAERRVIEELRNGSTSIGRLPIGPTKPAIGMAEVTRAARTARRILAAPVVLTAGTAQVTLTPSQVASALRTEIQGSRLRLRVDPTALRTAIGPAFATIELAPKDATFAVNGTSVSVVPSVDGQIVSLDSAAQAIAEGRHSVLAHVTTTAPVHNTEWAQKLNITELVSSYTTNHPCCQPRVNNIHHGADTINGTIVEPGQTFSLNEKLGPRTTQKGYVLAPGIGANLEFEDSVGGGVSQLSTTVYNATFFGCYQDVTHTVHALYISRYPMGREATLNYPSIDNKFRNDSHSGILIRTSYSDTSLTVAFYGNKEGRSCRAEGPNILETIPVEKEYTDDPSLPTGTEKELAAGHTGYVVENFRIISRPGQPDVRERYVERYSMAKAKVARGTGPVPPPTTAPAAPPPAT
ncbi:MAG: VanW family protein [Acidimicrobiia bacterium]